MQVPFLPILGRGMERQINKLLMKQQQNNTSTTTPAQRWEAVRKIKTPTIITPEITMLDLCYQVDKKQHELKLLKREQREYQKKHKFCLSYFVTNGIRKYEIFSK